MFFQKVRGPLEKSIDEPPIQDSSPLHIGEA